MEWAGKPLEVGMNIITTSLAGFTALSSLYKSTDMIELDS